MITPDDPAPDQLTLGDWLLLTSLILAALVIMTRLALALLA